jgi:hypothetical protein
MEKIRVDSPILKDRVGRIMGTLVPPNPLNYIEIIFLPLLIKKFPQQTLKLNSYFFFKEANIIKKEVKYNVCLTRYKVY